MKKRRRYRKGRRAENEADTRQRIVDALVALHGDIGPARTTISAIAERAGVQRLTVYRHFPDEKAMFHACSASFAATVPPPQTTNWENVDDPDERMMLTLLSFYDYYARAEPVLVHVFRDAQVMPALAAILEPWEAFVDQTVKGTSEAFGAKGTAGRILAAWVAHALRFETWLFLVRTEMLSAVEVADTMVRTAAMLTSASRRSRSSRSSARRRPSI